MLSRLFLLLPVAALCFPVNGKLTSPHVRKRDHISGLDDAQNLKYYANITLGGKDFSVQIDTGRQAINTLFSLFNLQLLFSSDLWVAGDIPNSNDTGVSAGVQYAVGGVNGKVMTAPLTFLNFSVPDQAFSVFRIYRCPFYANMHSSSGQCLFRLSGRSRPHWSWSQCRLKRS
jgi:hypothetical protein